MSDKQNMTLACGCHFDSEWRFFPSPYCSIRHLAGEPPSVPSSWQPIETAPKDGTFFIALDVRGGVGKVHWCERYTPHAWADEDGSFVGVTHWMPLPEPPK
jgi:hypothetical protein